jgi:TPR repeat protein
VSLSAFHCGLATPLVNAFVVVCLPLLVSRHRARHGYLHGNEERNDGALTEVPVSTQALALIRLLRFAFLAIVLCFAAQYCVAASHPQTQRIEASSADIPAMPSPGDPVTQYKLAFALLFDTHSTPDSVSAVRLLRSSASRHFAPAEFLLGYIYEHGRGVPVDYSKAAENYLAAAQHGDAGAENNLGGLYQYGRGFPKDINLAFKWYSASAQHGNATGQYNLGSFYHLGYATPPDIARAAEWFRASAEQGFAVAQAELAVFYFRGTGVPIDYALAAHWALLAAEQGLPHAAMNYAYLCEHGMGVPHDSLAAYIWYSRANAAGDKTGASHAKAVAHHLSRAQIDQAKSQLAAVAPHPQQSATTAANADVSFVENP